MTDVQIQQGERIQMIPVDVILPNPFQPRRNFNQKRLEELAESIRANGLAQPILLRPDGNGGLIQVLGDRRWRAYKLLGRAEIPALVREMTDQQARQITLIENLQREDLTIIEEAESFRDLVAVYDGNVSEVARQVGKNDVYVARRLKLLELPAHVQKLVEDEVIPLGIAEKIIEKVEPENYARASEMAVKHNLDENAFLGMVQRYFKKEKKKTHGASRDTQGEARFVQVRGTIQRLYDMLLPDKGGFPFEKLRDENKRASLLKQMVYLQKGLENAMARLQGSAAAAMKDEDLEENENSFDEDGEQTWGEE